MEITGRKVAIIGFGKEGLSAANYLGLTNQIAIYDDKTKREIDSDFLNNLKAENVGFYFGGKSPDGKFDLIVRSPGVRLDHPSVQKLTRGGATLTSATQIFFDNCPATIIGVTGTKGKGTTATLIFEMLKCHYPSVFLGGNIGTPALDLMPKLKDDSLVILELSSFQLMDLTTSPQIAVVLMITSEHLDWHKSTNEYQEAKESIIKYQSKKDFAVINQDFPVTKNFAKKTKAKVYFTSTESRASGVYIGRSRVISRIGKREMIASIKDIKIPGRHNLQNVVAATAVAKILDVSANHISKVLRTFKGLPNRLQFIKEIAGVKFYNDSFSTIPETTIAALVAFKTPKIIILGGSSKKSDFRGLGAKIASDKTIKAIVLIGQEARRIRSAIEYSGPLGAKILEGAKNMQQIVNLAASIAASGDIVILSPACASFDMFKNYQDRGEQFIQEVNKLRE